THVNGDLPGKAGEGFQVEESDHRVGPRGETGPRVLPIPAVTDAAGRDALDPDSRQRTPGGRNLRDGRPDQAQRAPPGEQPAEVRRHRVGELKSEGADEVAGGKRSTLAQVDHPLTGARPLSELCGVAQRWQSKVGNS